jgi:hypothetical protein
MNVEAKTVSKMIMVRMLIQMISENIGSVSKFLMKISKVSLWIMERTVI